MASSPPKKVAPSPDHPSFPSKPFSIPRFADCFLESDQVLVPIANGTEPMEAVITIDVLRRAGADVTVASAEKDLRVEACWGIKIVADALVSDCAGSSFDLISLPVS